MCTEPSPTSKPQRNAGCCTVCSAGITAYKYGCALFRQIIKSVSSSSTPELFSQSVIQISASHPQTFTMIAIRILIVSLALVALTQVQAQSNIDGGLVSTARIVAKLCLCSNRDPTIAQRFFDCYDVAPAAKPLFVKCQMEVNGYLLNTQENVRKSCRSLTLFPKYAACLQREFAAAGLDMAATLDAVNKCEAQVVGIN